MCVLIYTHAGLGSRGWNSAHKTSLTQERKTAIKTNFRLSLSGSSSEVFGHLLNHSNNDLASATSFCNKIFDGVDPLGRSVMDPVNPAAAGKGSLGPMQFSEQGLSNYGDEPITSHSGSQSKIGLLEMSPYLIF